MQLEKRYFYSVNVVDAVIQKDSAGTQMAFASLI